MLYYCPWLVHLSTVKDQIARSHLFKFKVDWAGVKLVALIPTSKLETKIFLQVVNGSPNESATVKEQRRVVKRVIRLTISLCVRYSNILFALSNELLAEPVFELL